MIRRTDKLSIQDISAFGMAFPGGVANVYRMLGEEIAFYSIHYIISTISIVSTISMTLYLSDFIYIHDTNYTDSIRYP